MAERVSLLLPLRDEVDRAGDCLVSVLAQTGVADLEILVLDDGSVDGTADLVRAIAGDDPRVRVLSGGELPPGWLGKPHACAQLAAQATGSVLVFLDADVRLEPHALAATVGLLRETGLDLISPYPRQVAGTVAERLVQPLLPWSWLTTLPLRAAERSPRESLAAANGQLLAVDAAAYHRAGGHGAVRADVLEDVTLLRALKRTGGTGGVVDGSRIARCRMYEGWDQVRDGWTKGLWAAFGSEAGATAVMAGLGVVYVVPPVAALAGSPVGLAGYAAGVGGRYVTARRTGGRALPDALAHPVSIGLLALLTARSWLGRRGDGLRWKGRAVVVAAAATLALTGCSGGGPSDRASAELLAAAPATAGPTSTNPTTTSASTGPAAAQGSGRSAAPTAVGTVGSLVEGFPIDQLPPPPGATVTSSAYDPTAPDAPDGREVAEVSLSGTTRGDGRTLVTYFRKLLGKQGFVAVDTTLADGVAGATFSRHGGNEMLTLGVADAAGGELRTFSIGGTLAR